MDFTVPAANECEISLFGPGFGECLCLHLGDGAWAIVDSCVDPGDQLPVALRYFERLGLDPAEVVKLVLITHWHDDHIKGIGRVIAACPGADVACSAAVRREDSRAFIAEQQGTGGRAGSGVDELAYVLDLTLERGASPIWAKSRLPLYPPGLYVTPILSALSPSDDDLTRTFAMGAAAITGGAPRPRRRVVNPATPNRGSVALWLSAGEARALLGADLDESGNPLSGWSAVLAHPAPVDKASLVKIPHHGSPGSHHDGIWTDLLETDPVAIITPFSNGDVSLPSDADMERIGKWSSECYLTAPPSRTATVSVPSEIAGVLSGHLAPLERPRGFGHVRARRSMTQPTSTWTIATGGSAGVAV